MESDQTTVGFEGGNTKKLLLRRKIEKNRICIVFVIDDIYVRNAKLPEGPLRCFYLVQNGHLSDSLIGEL